MKVSIIIPAYNEEKRLPQTLKRIKEFLRGENWESEIIIVDDGSEDRTTQVAIKEGIKVIKNSSNQGKGYSVKRGVEAAEGEYIFFTDADLSTPIEEIDGFLAWLEKEYDIVIGSRTHPEAKILRHQAKYRENMGKFFNLLVRMLFQIPFRDTQCGFKGFKKKVAKRLFRELSCRGFAFDVELIVKAWKAGYRIKEIGVTWINSPDSRVKLTSSPLSMLWELFKIRLETCRKN